MSLTLPLGTQGSDAICTRNRLFGAACSWVSFLLAVACSNPTELDEAVTREPTDASVFAPARTPASPGTSSSAPSSIASPHASSPGNQSFGVVNARTAAPSSPSVAVDPKLTRAQIDRYRRSLAPHFKRTRRGLRTTSQHGAEIVELEGGYQEVMLQVRDDQGNVHTSCVSDERELLQVLTPSGKP